MGRLLLESYTREGRTWLDERTFRLLCSSMSRLIHDETLEHFVIIMTDTDRKQVFLHGAEEFPAHSYEFRQGQSGVARLEPKIIVLDDYVEGLARDEGRKIKRIFTYLVNTETYPYMGFQLHYYGAGEASQFVLPIDERRDIVYVVGKEILLQPKHI
ncbi:hypothetical protein HY639_01895 [Candidatus Woesearchaeota archaeon]|nr:hypothetical protein [Candidatus Woesearchaeota archaeon]